MKKYISLVLLFALAANVTLLCAEETKAPKKSWWKTCPLPEKTKVWIANNQLLSAGIAALIAVGVYGIYKCASCSENKDMSKCLSRN